MSTTTIRLADDLKARIAEAAKAAGTTSHNFILEAIAEKAEQVEQRAALHAVADERYARILETGESIPWDEARTYLQQRLAGERVKRAAVKKQAR